MKQIRTLYVGSLEDEEAKTNMMSPEEVLQVCCNVGLVKQMCGRV